MKIFTIKTKITLWYTFFMIILVSLMFGIMIKFTDNAIFSNQKKILIETVEDINDGDSFEYFDDGIYILKYGKDKKYSEGSIPENFDTDIFMKTVIGGAFFLFPFLVIFSSAVGYFITKRAFDPVKKIQETAQG